MFPSPDNETTNGNVQWNNNWNCLGFPKRRRTRVEEKLKICSKCENNKGFLCVESTPLIFNEETYDGDKWKNWNTGGMKKMTKRVLMKLKSFSESTSILFCAFVFVQASEKCDKNLYTSQRRYLSSIKKIILKAFIPWFEKKKQIEIELVDF